MTRKKPAVASQEIELLAALAEEGCPICNSIAGGDEHYFFWFFNENYYEAHTLNALTHSLGFCLAHGARLARTSLGSQQLAAVHEVLVRRIRGMLSGPRTGRTEGKPQGSALATCALWPVCRDRKEAAERAVFWTVNLLEDPGRAEHYARPGLLCYPHLQRAYGASAEYAVRRCL